MAFNPQQKVRLNKQNWKESPVWDWFLQGGRGRWFVLLGVFCFVLVLGFVVVVGWLVGFVCFVLVFFRLIRLYNLLTVAGSTSGHSSHLCVSLVAVLGVWSLECEGVEARSTNPEHRGYRYIGEAGASVGRTGTGGCAAHLGLNLGHGEMCISCMRWGVWEQVLRCVQQAVLCMVSLEMERDVQIVVGPRIWEVQF